ncbi:molybdenum cofactor guanylyltransferase [Castellaniella sp.]|uniref:molybdenum cofactor guanylyltransferase n=1 Tax=Castellaniella sp. TaxID=1955812 RepID=UPI00355F24B1
MAGSYVPVARVQGLILAGGQSTRMRSVQRPGADKGLMIWQGRPLVAQAGGYMRSQGVSSLFISANRHLLDYARHGPVLTDPSGLLGSGPLAGVLAGLLHAPADWLFVVPVDVPGLPGDLLQRLAARASPQHPAHARTPAGPHPLCLLVHASQAPALEAFLRTGQRRVQAWLGHVQARAVDFQPESEWRNLNAPADWR